MEKITKKTAKDVYSKLMVDICGLSINDAKNDANEKVISGKKDGDKFLIKIKTDWENVVEYIVLKNDVIVNYKTLIKVKNDYFLWTDDVKSLGKKIPFIF